MTEETMEEFQARTRKEFGAMYYDRQGKEIELMDWGHKCEDFDYRIVKTENIDRWHVSTVWIGLNMNLFRKGPPIIFETMIFLLDKDNPEKENDPLHLYQERYRTEEEAIRGHEEAMSACRGQLLIEKRIRELESLGVGKETDSQ